MSRKSYTWLDQEHTQVAESIDPPEPTVIVIVDLQAAIDACTAEITAMQSAVKTDTQMMTDVQNIAAAETNPLVARGLIEDEIEGNETIKQSIVNKTANRQALQDLLNTINAEAVEA